MIVAEGGRLAERSFAHRWYRHDATENGSNISPSHP